MRFCKERRPGRRRAKDGRFQPSPFQAMPATMPALKSFSIMPPFSSTPEMIFFMKLPVRAGTVIMKFGLDSLRLIGMLRRVAMPPPLESTK